ncbi:Pentatricopeptide repeat-containing protein At4g04790, mitochondrial [Linum perenne]
MSRSKALSSIFGAAVKSVKTSSAVTECSTPILKTTSTSAVSSPSISSHAVEHFVSTIDACSKPTFSSSSSASATKRSAKLPKKRSIATKNHPCLSSSTLPDLKLEASESDSVTEVTATIAQEVAAIIYDQTYGVLPNAQGGSGDDEKSLGHELTIPWTHLTCKNLSHQQKVSRRERKEKWIFSSSQVNRVERLARCCVEKLGSDTTFNVFGKIGRETGVKEFDALIKSCLKIARQSKDLEIILKHVSNCFRFLSVMKEQGFQIEENTYGPVLMYLIEMSMVEEFHLFLQAIRTENASSLARLGYYEMLLYITVGDEQKIQELCSSVSSGSETGSLKIHENYLLALCESNRKNDLLPLLDVIDFEDVMLKVKELHSELAVKLSIASYEELIAYCCDQLEVRRLYPLISNHDLQPTIETFKKMINLSVKVLVDQTDEALNEVKSVVISALACHGQYSDALTIFKETKAARNNVAPKAVISLIEYFPSDGEKKKFRDDEMVMDVIFDEVCSPGHNYYYSSTWGLTHLLFKMQFFATIADTEPADVRTGMKLLGIIKTELGLSPSRKCLDFLLHTCGKAKDLPHARAVWKEYEIAHLPYNIMSYLRMYQVLMATGGHTLAKTILSKIPKDDRHVRMMIKTCRMK